ncbi:MAG TPA: PQQ-binding-like beta-propeller repeat protein [Planctomycetota bacterium]|nr:PQQ-binding-like beta-propeller repeat protein [Planctomycetota bacterium]
MKNRRFWPLAGAMAALFLFFAADNAWAAIPAVVGPIQALIAILPQLMAMLGAALVAMLKPGTYKVLVKYLWTHKLFTVGFAGFIWLCVWGCGKLFAGGVGAEGVGENWSAFRGGQARLGAVSNAKGPDAYAKPAWRYQEEPLERVDSSPCVVGNRVYVSTGTLRLIGASTGTIYCRDADKGGEVWRWTAKDLPDTTEAEKQMKKHWLGRKGDNLENLKPIFSSPVVGGDYANSKDVPAEKGKPQQGRYLVVGEGYHTDWNSRIICLDLEPVKTGKSKKPRLAWYKQTTCHVESSPSILGDRVYIGAADDGVWCIELATGKTVWHMEGTPAYYVTSASPKAAELEGLVGKFVRAVGSVERIGATITEPGEARFTVREIEVVDDPSKVTFQEFDNGQTFERQVVGKVTAVPKAPNITIDNKVQPLDGISKVSIVPPEFAIDVESSPVAVTLTKEQTPPLATPIPVKDDGKGGKARDPEYIGVYVGFGFGGEAVACIDGATGRLLWKTPGKLGFPVFGSPTVVGDKVVVGMGNGDIINDDPNPKGEVRCYSTRGSEEKGKENEAKLIWKFEAKNTILGSVPVYTDAKKGQTLAYACSRDKNLYVLNVNDKPDANGKIKETKKVWIGSKMVCSPAVTNDAIYLTTDGGRVVCVNRDPVFKRWSFPLCPGQQIISSPAVAGGKIFVGSVNKGVYGLVNDPAGDPMKREAQPWAGQGGTPDRGAIADEMGMPGISDQKAPRMWSEYRLCKFDAEGSVEKSRTMEGPVAACGQAMYLMLRSEAADDDKPYLARVNLINGRQEWLKDLGAPVSAIAAQESRIYVLTGAKGDGQKLLCLNAADGAPAWSSPAPDLAEGVLTLVGQRLLVAPKAGGLRCLPNSGQGKLWELPLGPVVGSPAADWGLIIVNIGGDSPRVVCLSDVKGTEIWSAKLPGKPVGPPAVTGAGLVFAACAAPGGEKGIMACIRLTDGQEAWQKEIPGLPVHYPAASDEAVAVASAKGMLYAFAAADGRFLGWDEGRQPIPGLQAPALAQGTVLFAGEKRVSTWNAPSAEWPWFFRDQGIIGKVLAPPVVACETVYVVTEKRGVVAIAPPPSPRIFETELADRKKPLADGRLRMEFQCREDANGIKAESVQVELFRLVEKPNAKTGEKETVAQSEGKLVEGGLWKVSCPEIKAAEGQPAVAVAADGAVTVTFTSPKPLSAGEYEVKASVASKAGARTDETWKLVISKEGAGK